MKRDRFYKTSCHSDVGSNVTFHQINGKGYGTDIDSAHIYSREEAQQIVDDGHMRVANQQELFLSADHVDEISVWKVDCQIISLNYPEHKDPKNEYVLYEKNRWDGNDLAFATDLGSTFDYSQATVFSQERITSLNMDGWVAVPKFHTDEAARRTFQRRNINRRKMISGAGIIGIYKAKDSNSSGKTRMNCPKCGKIAWQYNPYDFEKCSDRNCSGRVDDYYLYSKYAI